MAKAEECSTVSCGGSFLCLVLSSQRRDGCLLMPTEGERYWRDADGHWVENVGPWVKEKHKILSDYVQICSGARKGYKHCSFIDVFCGPGRARVRDSGQIVDGSSVTAYKQAYRSGAPFSQIFISD